MSQTERILFIDRNLRNTGFITVKQVADYFEVSTRQVKRDIEYMRDRFEAPIQWDFTRKVYNYSESFKRLEFADQHLILAYLSMQSMLKNANYFPAVSEELLQNFTNQIPKEYLSVCDKIHYSVPASSALDPQFFAMICTSLRNRKCIEVLYQNSKNEESLRTVEPYNLINYGGNWYVICFDHLRKELRTFHVSRIKKITSKEEDFMNHGTDFDEKLEAFTSRGFGIFFGDKTVGVKIRFLRKAAIIVRSQSWHPKQTVQEVNMNAGEEEILLSFPAAALTEVLSKILGYGCDAIPLEPEELRTMWKDQIKKMSELAGN